MTIDWITVGAQIINLLILVALLKRFLYRPILDGIAAREQQIAERMGEAAEIEARSETVKQDYQARVQRLQEEREAALVELRQSAERERDALLADAADRIDRDTQSHAQHQERQSLNALRELQDRSGELILQTLRKALQELSDESLEERLAQRALTALWQNISEPTTDGRVPDEGTVEVCTRDPLSIDAQERMRCALATHKPDLDVSFVHRPEQSPGARVRFGSVQVDWSVDTYVTALSDALKRALMQKVERAA